MKISYERLNQIIEEEVVRFKKINEQAAAPTTDTASPTGTGTLTDAQKKDPAAISVAIQALMSGKPAADLLKIYTSLGGK